MKCLLLTIRECYDACFEWRESGHAAAYLAVQSTLRGLAKGWPEDSSSPSLRRRLVVLDELAPLSGLSNDSSQRDHQIVRRDFFFFAARRD